MATRRRGAVVAAAVLLGAAGAAVGHSAPVRWFADRPVAWNEHDDANIAKLPEVNHLQDEAVTVTIRDSLANEADRLLAAEGGLPAQDVNAADEVPCSTWFCARNHLHPMALDEIAAGPPAAPPALPLKIVKGKDEGAATGFQVVDAKGKKFMLKLDPRGHLGLATAAEMIGERIFHAAGYNVPGASLVELAPSDLQLAPTATFKLFGVEKRPLTAARVEAQLAGAARLPDGRLRGVAVPWLGGQILGSYDTTGVRAGDPNDRIPHEHRRSLRASWVLFAWLSVLDPGPINTLDSVVEESGRHFVRHYMFDFTCAFGSATSYVQGPQQDGEYLIEIGRTLRALFSFGFYQRPFQAADARLEYRNLSERYPSIGYFPAETFDPDSYRPNRRVPPHMRMTARDAYWGAKIVTSFSDGQLHAIVAAARLPEPDAAYVEHALCVRRDIIGRRFLRAVAAVESPAVAADGGEVCFEDLAVDRGYVGALGASYLVDVADGDGRPLASFEQPVSGPHACVGIGDAEPGIGYRVVRVRERLPEAEGDRATAVGKATSIHLRWRDRENRFVVVGWERDE
jgi:hypothetical protein